MLRLSSLAVFFLALWALLAAAAATASGKQPNVVIILADDMGWNDVGYHGSDIQTPNLDQLAAEGVELQRFYAQTSCSPTRAALLSGQSPQSLGMYSPLSKLNPTGLPLKAKLMPEYFRDAGYQTFLVGKWHLGFHQPAYRPNARGFDHFYGNVTGGIGYWDHVHGGGLDWQRNGETLREEGYSTHLLVAEIDRAITQRDPDRPVFLYAAFTAPHLPNEAPPEAIATYAHIEDPNRRVHAAMVTELDTAIGQLKATLAAEGMLENTIIWFMSDNGGLNVGAFSPGLVGLARFLENWFGVPVFNTTLEFIRTNVLDGGADNSPFRKGKQSVYEGGTRVPSLVYWPGTLAPGRNGQMITVLDVLPTLLSATGLGVSEAGSELHGADHWLSLVSGTRGQAPDYFINGRDGEALFRYPWKLLALDSGEVELYQLEDDPRETTDLSDSHPEKVAELQQALDAAPRGESVHVPTYRALLDMDFFGGEEDRPPWSEIDKH